MYKIGLAWICLASLSSVVAWEAANATGENAAASAQQGERIFAGRCAMCHGQAGQGTSMAPTLKNISGRKAGSTAFAGYSSSLRQSNLVWTDAEIAAFLENPSKKVPGTRMFIKVPDAASRQQLVAYLKTLR